jgi:LysM repeat protein
MSNPNPFVPKGSLLERQTQSRSRLKIGVSCVLAVSIIGLVAMLIQGCKRAPDADTSNSSTMTDTNPVPADMSTNPVVDTNAPAPAPTGTNVAYTAPTPPPPPMPVPTPVVDNTAAAGSEYVVQSGDTLGKIAKHNGVSLKALEAANPGVDSKHLKVKQKLVIPGGTGGTSANSATSGAPDMSSGSSDSDVEMYTVKTGDTLSKIARTHGSSVKAIEAANNLSTTKINVGKKLKIPRKASASAPAPVAPVDNTPPPQPAPPAPSQIPSSAPAPAPSSN